MNSMKLVITLHSLYWSIHTKDESKRGSAFAFILVSIDLCNECNGMTSFMEFIHFLTLI